MHKVRASARLRTGGVQQTQYSQNIDNISLQDPVLTKYTTNISTKVYPSPTKLLIQLSTHQESLTDALNQALFVSFAAAFSDTACDTTFFQKKRKKIKYLHLSGTKQKAPSDEI